MRHLLILSIVLAACSTGSSTNGDLTPVPIPDPGDARISPTIGLRADARIQAMLRDVEAWRIHSYDSSLVSFGTRNTYSDTLSGTRGIGAARRWIHAQFSKFSADCGGCLRVEYVSDTITHSRFPGDPARQVTNVAAWLPGRDTTRVIVIGGHYDSCLCAVRGADGTPGGLDSTVTAPGANDDGSGTSAVIELARVFSRAFPRGLDASVIFVAHDAEEQGLLGSRVLARRLKAGGYNVIAGMTDDIVGNVTAANGYVDSTSVRIFAPDPDTSASRELARYVWAVGELYLPDFEVIPVWRLDRFGRGGDHRSYIEQGFPGLRFTERVENELRQHRPADLLSGVNFGYIANVARLNAAAIASLGLSPAVPDSITSRRELRESGGRRWILSWAPVPGAVGYEVLVRQTTSPQYERIYTVGAATTYNLDYQLDEAWAGIRAIGANGHRSVTAIAPNIRRRR